MIFLADQDLPAALPRDGQAPIPLFPHAISQPFGGLGEPGGASYICLYIPSVMHNYSKKEFFYFI